MLYKKSIGPLLLSAALLAAPQPAAAQEAAASTQGAAAEAVPSRYISPQAQAVVTRMTAYLKGLQAFEIEADSTRDEVVALGYKLQHNERSKLLVQRPDKLRAKLEGDLRDRTIVYDGANAVIYSPVDDAYVKVAVPNSLEQLIGDLLEAGVEMPMIDVLYQAVAGTLTEAVRGGVLVGESVIDGVKCDHLAFRQLNVDWQLWVEQGARPVPRKIVITTRYQVGDPQYQAVLRWNLSPRIDASTFVFTPPQGASEIPLVTATPEAAKP